MPPLPNTKHEHFAQLIAQGRSAPSAYHQSSGYTTSWSSAGPAAQRLLSQEKIRQRIHELQPALYPSEPHITENTPLLTTSDHHTTSDPTTPAAPPAGEPQATFTKADAIAWALAVLHTKPEEARADNPLCEVKINASGPAYIFPSKEKMLDLLITLTGLAPPASKSPALTPSHTNASPPTAGLTPDTRAQIEHHLRLLEN